MKLNGVDGLHCISANFLVLMVIIIDMQSLVTQGLYILKYSRVVGQEVGNFSNDSEEN